MNPLLRERTEALVEAFVNSEEYHNYLLSREVLMEDQELYQKVCEFRKRNFYLQTEGKEETLFDDLARLEQEFAPIRKDRRVSEFLQYELGLCKAIQEIEEILTDHIDFDLELID